MALADRDYYGEPEPRRSHSRLTPVVKSVLILNIVLFILDYLILAPSMSGREVIRNEEELLQELFPPLVNHGAFRISEGIHGLQLWQLISFQFLHGHFMHILMNSIGLFIFGPWMERHFGSLKFTIYYLACGAAGALLYTLLGSIGILSTQASLMGYSIERPLVGASAGIIGCIIGVAVLAPQMRVQLFFPPIVLTMRQLCIVILCIAVGFIIFNLQNAGGEAGHLGGAIAGFVLMRYVPWFRRGAGTSRRPKRRVRYESKISPRSEAHLTEDNEIDEILDKVSANGFQSLTDTEKSILRKAAGEKEP